MLIIERFLRNFNWNVLIYERGRSAYEIGIAFVGNPLYTVGDKPLDTIAKQIDCDGVRNVYREAWN